MHTLSAKLTFYIPYATSLKDKQQIRRSLIDRAKQKFNASISEVDTQDILQTLTIGIAVVSGEYSHAQNMLDEVVRFMDSNTDAELTKVER